MKERRERLPLTAVAIVVASALLATILAVATFRNVQREQKLMESFLLREGLTLLRGAEAGARAALSRGPADGQAGLETLLREVSRGQAVAYLRVVGQDGGVLAEEVRQRADVPGDFAPASDVVSNGWMRTRLVKTASGKRIFEVARAFNAPVAREQPEREPSCWEGWAGCSWRSQGAGASDRSGAIGAGGSGNGARGAVDVAARKAVYLGLYTKEFDDARAEDVRRSLIMAGVLLLSGIAGFYFLFLSQNVRVARATIENMTLYNHDVIESMPDGLVTLDSQGRVVSMNRKGEELLGASAAQALGKCLKDVSGPERCDLEPLVRGGGDFRDFPMDCLAADGKSVPVKVSGSRLTSRDGEKLGTVLLLRDIREIRDMEERVERSRRLAALGHLAAGIAHEIRNPLGTLRGFAQYFGGICKADPEGAEYAGLMVGEVDRLNRIVEALLQFARPREREFREISLGEVLGRAQKLLQGDFEAAGVAFSLEPPLRDVRFPADPDLLTQVLLNLLQNAVAATAEGGQVGLGGRLDGDRVRLWVDDTGKGLTAEERQRMFDPFFTTKRTGTGLGLAVVHQIVEQHGDAIEVESKPGEGTRVLMALPVTRA
jgi:two-component system sensor histidine kinase HydH